ncbi:hypothetical protein DFJ74DRAFT_693612 [Hyaloraphidium curvatum]|nr:hypothetical protein DFJ74DRAFT_693612 [Hyaloraphidium curvatum]
MSINSAVFAAGSPTPLLVVGREQLLAQADKVELTLASSSEHGAPGNYAFSSGSIYVTPIRVIYVPKPAPAGCSSVVLPLDNIRNAKLEQPMFSSNFWVGVVVPVPGCGLPNVPMCSVKLVFPSGGASGIHTAILRASGGTGMSSPSLQPE